MTVRTFPGALAPARHRHVTASGARIAVHEWGDVEDPVLFLVHGGFDFARTFDVFAPLIAAAGWRVIAWDQRGHGDSEHTGLYSWDADLRDALAVMDDATRDPSPVIAHSKGGALMIQLADAHPYRFRCLVNLDGIPSRRRLPDVAEHERTRLLSSEVSTWLDHRRRTAHAIRKPGTIEDLARRRARMNPRLDPLWLEYLVTVGGFESPDGWRWKLDPTMRFGGFGPWRPEWSMLRLPGLSIPFLGVLGTEIEDMAWGTRIGDVEPILPSGGIVEAAEGRGHFLHIEDPVGTSQRALAFVEAHR